MGGQTLLSSCLASRLLEELLRAHVDFLTYECSSSVKNHGWCS